MVVSCHVGLGIEPRFSAKATSVLTSWTISPASDSLVLKSYQTHCKNQIAKKKECQGKNAHWRLMKGGKGFGFCLSLNRLSSLHLLGSLNTYPYGSCQCSQWFPESHTETHFYSHCRDHSLARKPVRFRRDRSAPTRPDSRKQHSFLSQTVPSMPPFEVRTDSIAVLMAIWSRYRTCQNNTGTRRGITYPFHS